MDTGWDIGMNAGYRICGIRGVRIENRHNNSAEVRLPSKWFSGIVSFIIFGSN
jgi:hypothetical protein